MKAVVERVKFARVRVDGETVGEINKGLLVLLGVFESDEKTDAELLAKKTAGLRIFSDENDKMNLSALSVGAEILVVSNFTLCADCKSGNRPSFSHAKAPKEAEELYRYFTDRLKALGINKTANGVFGADMKIETEMDGPITITLDTDVWSKQ